MPRLAVHYRNAVEGGLLERRPADDEVAVLLEETLHLMSRHQPVVPIVVYQTFTTQLHQQVIWILGTAAAAGGRHPPQVRLRSLRLAARGIGLRLLGVFSTFVQVRITGDLLGTRTETSIWQIDPWTIGGEGLFLAGTAGRRRLLVGGRTDVRGRLIFPRREGQHHGLLLRTTTRDVHLLRHVARQRQLLPRTRSRPIIS